jgi:hypothetical protein
MSAEPDEDIGPLGTYGGQPPEHEDFSALALSPNVPTADDNAIAGIDQDPASTASGSGPAPDIAMPDIALASDMLAPSVLPAAVIVAAPVTLAAATTLEEPISEFERGRLAGLASATAAIPVVLSQSPMVARVDGLPFASPPVSVRVARGLFPPPLGSAQGAVRPLSLGPSVAAPAVSEPRNLLDPELEQIHSAALPSANLSGPRGVWTAAPVFGPQRQTLAARPITRQGLRPNPPWIMPAGLAAHVTSTSPGGSTAPSLTDVPAEVLLEDPVDNMDMRAHVKDPTKYLSVITQYCRTREYHGRQLHLSPAENRSAYLTYRYHVKQAMDISSAPKTVSAYSYAACLLLTGGALELIVTYQAQNEEVPDQATVFALLESQLADSATGQLTEALQINNMHILSIAKDLQVRMRASVAPDISTVMSEIRIIRDRRNKIHAFDTLSYCIWILNLLRGPAEELVEMRDVASTKHDNGIKVQQLDPDLMVRSILSCGKVWQSYYQRSGNKVPSDVTDEDSREERRQDGASGSRDRKAGASKRPNPNPNPRDKKRSNPLGAPRPAPPTDRGSFDPFTRYGSLVTASRTDSNVRPWVKNMTSQKSAALRAEKKCIFCEKVGHFSDMCPDREGMFRAKKACFHPAK